MSTLEAVNAIKEVDDVALRQHVLEVLSRELSLSEFVRYIRLFHPKTGNYTEDRHQWLGPQPQDGDAPTHA